MQTLRSTILLSLTLAALVSITSSTGAAQDTTSASQQSAEPGPSSSGPSSADPDLRSEVQLLQELVRAQQKRIDALEADHNPVPSHSVVDAPAPPAATLEASTPSSTAAPQNSPRAQNVQAGSSDERIRNLERQIKGLGPVSFSGDVRVRAEPFFGGPTDHSLDRARARIRARFNAMADKP